VLAPYPGIKRVVSPRNFAVFHNFHPIEITLAAFPPALRLFTRFRFAPERKKRSSDGLDVEIQIAPLRSNA
jgi:hypothetical protein